MSNRNKIKIYTHIDKSVVSNFSLYEFEDKDGFVMIHSSIPWSCEMTRAQLNKMLFPNAISMVITGGTRSDKRNAELAEGLGWIDEGGLVSRTSRHLQKYGGIAVDWYAYNKTKKEIVPQKICGDAARMFFDFVKDDYADGHIHSDNRNHK